MLFVILAILVAVSALPVTSPINVASVPSSPFSNILLVLSLAKTSPVVFPVTSPIRFPTTELLNVLTPAIVS